MAGTSWTPDEEMRLREMLKAHKPYREIGLALGRSASAVGVYASRAGFAGNGASKAIWADAERRAALILDWPTFRARYPDRTHSAYLNARREMRADLDAGAEITHYPSQVRELEGDAVVAACVHVPQTDPAIWARVLAVGAHRAIPTLIIAGDIVTGDMFSKWDLKEPYTFDEEMDSLGRHLEAALAVFGQIVITPGNHVNNRIVRISGGHIKLRHMIDACELRDAERARIVTTDIDYVKLQSGDQRFLVGHAANYSRIDGRVPVTYAEIMESHVIVGNGHRMGFGVSRSGRWHGYEVGTCANPALMGYAQRNLNSYPRMMQGFATVRNGAVRLYGRDKPFTDWEAELA